VVPDAADDDPLAATAVAGNADVLCTRNGYLDHQDVLAYCNQKTIQVMDDLALLRALRKGEGAASCGGPASKNQRAMTSIIRSPPSPWKR
jgi:hypothetical protein